MILRIAQFFKGLFFDPPSFSILSMKYRQLGRTEISVSEIGFGTWGIGGLTEGATSYGETSDSESIQALNFAFEKGINFFDTSNIYGNGHAEKLLGEVFGKKRDKVVIASKVGFVKHGGHHNVSPAYIRSCLTESLRRLKSDYVDIYQFHSVPIKMIEKELAGLETMKELKKEGKIRAVGYSVKNPEDALVAIEKYGVDAVQVNFNMIDERIITLGVLEKAKDFGVGVIARTPLAFGFLSGLITDLNFNKSDHRSKWSMEQLKKWKSAPEAFAFINSSKIYTPVQFALKFCISFKEISTVIPGMFHVKEIEENSATSDLPPLTEAQLELIKKVNSENKFFISAVNE